MARADIQAFFTWFQQCGGDVDTAAMDIIDFPPEEGGRGAVALKNIPEGHVVFSIPRSLILSTETSSLPAKFGSSAWRQFRLDEGWAGLILCMMWEAAQGPLSKWSTYLEIMPMQFDTPMFWSEQELSELAGTAVQEKLGKEQAQKDYEEKVIPAIHGRPDLFPPQEIANRYSLQMYHVMGSRILSRSFTLDNLEDDEDEDEGPGNVSSSSAMDVDGAEAGNPAASDGLEEHDSDEDEENSPNVMVPMADMLNARYETENVKLFSEKKCLKMIATKPIEKGQQIWNTYGDPPNSELLRLYGHVDYMPLPDGGHGSPGDVVEVKGDIFARIVLADHPELTEEMLSERIDWWLEEGGDDVFVLEISAELPPPMVSFVKLLVSQEEWERTQQKGKPPKPKADSTILSVIKRALEQRLSMYPTTLMDDEAILNDPSTPPRKRNSIVVRSGEKRILLRLLDSVTQALAAESGQGPSSGGDKKRRGAGSSSEAQKKAKRS